MSVQPVSLAESVFGNHLILSSVLSWIAADKILPSGGFTAYRTLGESEVENLTKLDTQEACEILENDQYEFQTCGVLFRCILVNSLWYNTGVALLWRDIGASMNSDAEQDSLLLNFRNITALSRRQFYANLVQTVDLWSNPDDEADWEALLADLAFPRLRKIVAHISYDCMLPPFRGHEVQEIVLDPSFDVYPDTYRVGPDEMRRVLEDIEQWFPDVRRVSFVDRCLAYPGEMDNFRKKMKHLEELESTLVLESAERL